MLVHVLGGSAAMRGSIPPVACAPPAESGAPGEPGSGSSREPGLRRGRQQGHGPLWPGPERNIPRVRWGLETGVARRRGQPGTHPGAAAPRGTNRVTRGAPLLRGLAGGDTLGGDTRRGGRLLGFLASLASGLHIRACPCPLR